MASETTRMFRAVVVAGVSLTACSGAPVVVPTPDGSPVDPVNDGKSVEPVIGPPARVEAAAAPTDDSKPVPVEATPVASAGDPLATTAEGEPKRAKKSAKSAAERKREAEERKRRELEEKFPLIL